MGDAKPQDGAGDNLTVNIPKVDNLEHDNGNVALYQIKGQYDSYDTNAFGNPLQGNTNGTAENSESANAVSRSQAEYYVQTIVGQSGQK